MEMLRLWRCRLLPAGPKDKHEAGDAKLSYSHNRRKRSTGLRRASTVPNESRTSQAAFEETKEGAQIPCGICRRPFLASRLGTLLAHLGAHFDQRYNYHRCEQCKINFVTREDLYMHLNTAKDQSTCGFMFEHRHTCTGHHPPGRKRTKDDSRFDFCYRLRNWENVQQGSHNNDCSSSQSPASRRPASLGSLTSLFRLSVFNHSRDSGMSAGAMKSVCATNDFLGAALLRAICTGSTELVASFLQAGANVHFIDILGFGSIHYCCQYANPEITWMLLEHGVDINRSDSHGTSPLRHAIRSGRGDHVLHLLAWGSKVEGSDLWTAVQSGTCDTAETLLEYWIHNKRSIETLDQLLLSATKLRDYRMVDLLLSYGARAVTQDDIEKSALSIAVAAGDQKIAQALIDHGAEPDGWNERDHRPLSEVVRYRHLVMIESLLSAKQP